MAIESIRGFRLTVWRPFSHDRRIAQETPKNPGQAPLLPADALYEAVYEWQPRIDVWSSIPDAEVTNELRESLIQRFNPYESPANRTLGDLGLVIERLDKLISEEQGRWSDCDLPLDEAADLDMQFRANTLIALQRHLRWLHDVFRNVPGAAITIR